MKTIKKIGVLTIAAIIFATNSPAIGGGFFDLFFGDNQEEVARYWEGVRKKELEESLRILREKGREAYILHEQEKIAFQNGLSLDEMQVLMYGQPPHKTIRDVILEIDASERIVNEVIREKADYVHMQMRKKEAYNKAIKIIKAIHALCGEKYYRMNKEYSDATNVFLKKEAEFLAQSEETIQKASAALTPLNEFLKKEIPEPSLVKVMTARENLLEMFKKSTTYKDVIHLIFKLIQDGNCADKTKEHARNVLQSFETLGEEKIADAFDKIIKSLTLEECGQLGARLGVLCGFLTSHEIGGYVEFEDKNKPLRLSAESFRTKAVCTQNGICGIMHGAVASIGNIQENMEEMHKALIAGFDRVRTAGDVLRLITTRDGYIGEPYIGNGPVIPTVRSVPGGHASAQKLFDILSSGNTVNDIRNRKTGAPAKKIVLKDKTVIFYQTKVKNGDSVITISNAPAWILSGTIELRFENPVEKYFEQHEIPETLDDLKSEQQKLYEGLSEEEKKQFDELNR